MRWPRVDVHRASVDVRSREFERWQSHLISSRKVLPDANSRWPGGSSTAARPAASRSWSESPLAARAEHKRSYTLLSVHSACRAGLPRFQRQTHLRAAERRQSRRSRGSTRLAHPCTATALIVREGNCSRPRHSRAYANFGDVAAWSGRFCRSSSKALAKRVRHCQTNVMELRRLRGCTEPRMDAKATFRTPHQVFP